MTRALRPAVFLDRDGTLNMQTIRDGKPFSPRTVEEFELFPDVPESCAQLAAAGFVLVLATNQPDVGRGVLPRETLDAMHAKLRQLVPQIAHIEVATAAGDDPAQPPDRRRKPEPGMLRDAAAELGLDLARSWMIGDRWRDVDCGHRAGVRTVFIDFGYDEALRQAPDFRVRSFAEAARIVLTHSDYWRKAD